MRLPCSSRPGGQLQSASQIQAVQLAKIDNADAKVTGCESTCKLWGLPHSL